MIKNMETTLTQLQNQIQDLQSKVNHLNDIFFRQHSIDKDTFQNPVYFNGNVVFKTINFFKDTTIQTGSTTGAKIGATGDKIGFLGKTPIVRAGAITSPTAPSAAYVQAEAASAKTAIDAIRTVLINFGLTS